MYLSALNQVNSSACIIIAQLSIGTMLCGLLPLKGIRWGRSFCSIASQNTNSFTLSVVQCTPMKPFTVIIVMTDTRLPLDNKRTSLAYLPTNVFNCACKTNQRIAYSIPQWCTYNNYLAKSIQTCALYDVCHSHIRPRLQAFFGYMYISVSAKNLARSFSLH